MTNKVQWMVIMNPVTVGAFLLVSLGGLASLALSPAPISPMVGWWRKRLHAMKGEQVDE